VLTLDRHNGAYEWSKPNTSMVATINANGNPISRNARISGIGLADITGLSSVKVRSEPLDDLLRRQRVILHDSPQSSDLGAEFAYFALLFLIGQQNLNDLFVGRIADGFPPCIPRNILIGAVPILSSPPAVEPLGLTFFGRHNHNSIGQIVNWEFFLTQRRVVDLEELHSLIHCLLQSL
jgi:hypothetical protein